MIVIAINSKLEFLPFCLKMVPTLQNHSALFMILRKLPTGLLTGTYEFQTKV